MNFAQLVQIVLENEQFFHCIKSLSDEYFLVSDVFAAQNLVCGLFSIFDFHFIYIYLIFILNIFVYNDREKTLK